MSPLPSSPSNTPGEGNPTPEQKRAQREKSMLKAHADAKAHLEHLRKAASDKFHSEKDAWQPEPSTKPLEQGKVGPVIDGGGKPVKPKPGSGSSPVNPNPKKQIAPMPKNLNDKGTLQPMPYKKGTPSRRAGM